MSWHRIRVLQSTEHIHSNDTILAFLYDCPSKRGCMHRPPQTLEAPVYNWPSSQSVTDSLIHTFPVYQKPSPRLAESPRHLTSSPSSLLSLHPLKLLTHSKINLHLHLHTLQLPFPHQTTVPNSPHPHIHNGRHSHVPGPIHPQQHRGPLLHRPRAPPLQPPRPHRHRHRRRGRDRSCRRSRVGRGRC